MFLVLLVGKRIERDVKLEEPHLNLTCDQYNNQIALDVKIKGKDALEE